MFESKYICFKARSIVKKIARYYLYITSKQASNLKSTEKKTVQCAKDRNVDIL